MYMKREDLRVLKTEENIRNVFLKLLREKNLNRISVKEICQQARCSRNTFYLHYRYKEELYDQLVTECIEAIKQATLPVYSSLREASEEENKLYIRKIIQAAAGKGDIIRILSAKDGGEAFLLKLTDTIADSFKDNGRNLTGAEPDTRITCYYCFVAAGMAGFVMQWILHSDINEETAAEMLYDIAVGSMEKVAEYMQFLKKKKT